MSTKVCFSVDFQSSRTLSLAQAGRGGTILNDSITLNPSMMGFQPASSFSGTYNWLNGSKYSGGDNGNNLNVSVMDGKNQYVSAGISFTRKPDLDMFHLALAKKATPWLSFGASGKRFSTRSNNVAAQGKERAGFESGVSASVAIPRTIIESVPIQIGFTGDNLFHRPEDEPFVGPRQAGVGLKVTIKSMLMLYGDWVENFSSYKGNYPTYASGAELALGADLYLRGGLIGFRSKGFSYGLGWVGPKIGISYGFQNVREDADRNYQHAVTMDIFM